MKLLRFNLFYFFILSYIILSILNNDLTGQQIPVRKVEIESSLNKFRAQFTNTNKEELLKKLVDCFKTKIPPLFDRYINTSAVMKCFGTGLNAKFGEVEETGIQVSIPDTHEKYIKRHVLSYNPTEVKP